MKINVTIDTDHPMAPTTNDGVDNLTVQRAIENAITHMRVTGSTGATYRYSGTDSDYITAEVTR